MRLGAIYTILILFVVSCNNKPTNGRFSLELTDSVKTYLASTDLKGNDSIKKLYVNAPNNQEAIIQLMDWGMSLPPNKSTQVIECAIKNANRLKFKEGQLWGLLQKGNLCYTEFEDDSALYYYNTALDIASKQKNEKIKGWSYAHLGSLKRMIGMAPEAEEDLNKAVTIGNKIKDNKLLSLAYFHLAEVYRIGSNFEKSFYNYKFAIENANSIKDYKRLSSSYFNLGQIYFLQVQYDQALEHFQKAEQLCIQSKNTSQESLCLLMMAQIYEVQDDQKRLTECIEKCLPLARESNNKNALAYSLFYKGRVIKEKGEYDKALVYLQEALALAQDMRNGSLQTFCLINFGQIEAKKQSAKAIDYFEQSLAIAIQLNDPQRTSDAYRNISRYYFNQNNYKKGLEAGEKALTIALKEGYVEISTDVSLQMKTIYTKLNQLNKALDMANIHIEKKDSLVNSDQIKKLAAVEYGAREEKLKAEQLAKEKTLQAEKKVKDQEIKNQRLLKNTFIGGFGLVCILAFVVFRSLKQNKKAKREIEHQKLIVEEKHREITDSINYAERLQRSLMASTQLLDQYLKNYFVYFNPKEKVSGDFYWCNPLSNGKFLLACADSTGHGVPGAMMSMMNMNSLKESIKEGLTEPAQILNRTREIIIDTLKNDGSTEGGKDGMDCALLSFDFSTNRLAFALANNPLWLIRDGQLHEYKPDKMPVGKHDKQYSPFTQQEIQLKKDDFIIALTDGYPDQFGGEKGKKFKYANLQQLLLANIQYHPEIISQKLDNAFNDWKGDLEQVDDVCIIGIKV